ncbi:penicillin-binding protein activator LpoB, partial [Myxococcus xanthus]|nr:penicillin-binding protein activator LpoB [Myxococcus xanthus]
LALLQARGIGRVQRYPGGAQQEALFDAGDAKRQEEVLAWAREKQAKYALAGAVDEWRYKVGVDGEPAAGVTLQIIDVATGDTLWSGTGGKSGWSRESLSGVAQKLIRSLMDSGLSGAR